MNTLMELLMEPILKVEKIDNLYALEMYSLSLLLNFIQQLVQNDILSDIDALNTIKFTGKTVADDNPNLADVICKLSSFAELAVNKK